MGTTLANLHILGGNLEELRHLMPGAVVGVWSAGCVSVFAPDLAPVQADKRARALSGRIPQPVLSVWLFDSDAVGFSVFREGKRIAAHVHDPGGYQAMGNIPLFCRTWGLPEEDVPRLRAVWRKGDAEAQLDLTACLLGLPLAHDSEILPERLCRRETGPVDQWIRKRPAPPRIRNQAKAELIQEIAMFRLRGIPGSPSPCYVSEDPYDERCACCRCHLWEIRPDGTVRESWSTEHQIRLFAAEKRVIAADDRTGDILYDSAGRLSGRRIPGCLTPLENGKILRRVVLEGNAEELTCLSPDGQELWRRIFDPACSRFLAQNGRELLVRDNTGDLVLLDLSAGQEIGRCGLEGINVYQAAWNGGAWWIRP